MHCFAANKNGWQSYKRGGSFHMYVYKYHTFKTLTDVTLQLCEFLSYANQLFF